MAKAHIAFGKVQRKIFYLRTKIKFDITNEWIKLILELFVRND
jgi:hypothetical protein